MQGYLDFALTNFGLLRAEKLAAIFKDVNFSHAFSSDLLRAKRTAEIIIKDKQLAAA